VAEFGPYAIKQPPEVMEAMSDWCKETFKRNGYENIKNKCELDIDTY
jgi:oligoribonuclease (3'-5' exoribonuclease)